MPSGISPHSNCPLKVMIISGLSDTRLCSLLHSRLNMVKVALQAVCIHAVHHSAAAPRLMQHLATVHVSADPAQSQVHVHNLHFTDGMRKQP